MIRINLITEKRKKSIPIASLLPTVIAIIGFIGIGIGWFAGVEFLSDYNKDLIEKESEINAQINKEQQKTNTRDKLRSEIKKLKREISQLNQLSGADLVQWSKTLSDLSEKVPEKTVWITNMRIDSDRRVQLTAYSCAEETKGSSKEGEARLTLGIQNFINTLMKDDNIFKDVFLTSATKNMYEKKPVWRFEINCRLQKTLAN